MPQQSNVPSQVAQQRDKTENIDGDVDNEYINDDETKVKDNQLDQKESLNDEQQKVTKTKKEGTPYQFLNANGKIESVDKPELNEEKEGKQETEHYVNQIQSQASAVKPESKFVPTEAVSNYQSDTTQLPKNNNMPSRTFVGQGQSQYAQVAPTQGDSYVNFASQNQMAQTPQNFSSSPEPVAYYQGSFPPSSQNQGVNIAGQSQNTFFQTSPTLGDSHANFAEQNQVSPKVSLQNQEKQHSQDFQFVNPNQNNDKLTYSQQLKPNLDSSFEFAGRESSPADTNYADQTHQQAQENENFADQSRNWQNSFDHSQTIEGIVQIIFKNYSLASGVVSALLRSLLFSHNGPRVQISALPNICGLLFPKCCRLSSPSLKDWKNEYQPLHGEP